MVFANSRGGGTWAMEKPWLDGAATRVIFARARVRANRLGKRKGVAPAQAPRLSRVTNREGGSALAVIEDRRA
jgi:hypothetical protein